MQICYGLPETRRSDCVPPTRGEVPLLAVACISLSLFVSRAAVQDDAGRYYLDLGKHCAAHFGRRGAEVPGRQQAMRYERGAALFTEKRSRITFGPHAGLGVDDHESFTLECELRTTAGAFATILMCREGGAVHYSLVMGRKPGHVAFEIWSWNRERAMSRVPLDDGNWHRLAAAYDAGTRSMALIVDGHLHATVPVTRRFAGSNNPSLRLGDNLDEGVVQPFLGAVRNVRMQRGIPTRLDERLALERETRILERARVEEALHAWLRHERRARPPRAATRAEWTARARDIRARVQDALGLWPPPYCGARLAGRRSPLMGDTNARATDFARVRPQLDLALRRGGKLRREGYELERIYWQTFEDYWASGWLYTPAAASGAAVLCPHGHWRGGARHPTVQARCITLAKLGYVVLAVDSIHLYAPEIGLTPVSVMTWNNLRALEVLRAQPGVDPAKIGVTGASGGGQQTYYLTALRTGIAAAVPAVMACHFDQILLHDNVHCACNFVAHVVQAADVPQMSAAFAPAPQLFLSVTGDWTKKFPQRGYPPIRAIYGLFDATSRVDSEQWNKGHAYDRPMRNRMYAFFEHWLCGHEPPDEELEKAVPPTENPDWLQILDHPALRGRNTVPIVREFRQRLAVDPISRRVEHAVVRRRLADLFLRGDTPLPPGQRVERAKRWRWREREHDAWLIRSRHGVPLPALLIRPAAATRDGPVLIVTSDGGKSDVLDGRQGWLDRALLRGSPVLLVDVRYTGELDAGHAWRDKYGRIFGRDEGILQVRDLRRVVDALAEIPDLPQSQPVVLAFGATAAPAVFAAALDPRIAAVVAPELGATYRDGRRRPQISRVLLHGDLPAAVFLLGPQRRLHAGGCADPDRYAAAGAMRETIGRPTLAARHLDRVLETLGR